MYLRTTHGTRVSVLFVWVTRQIFWLGGGGEPDNFLVWMAAVNPSIIRLSCPYRGITLNIPVSTLPLEKEESARRVHLSFSQFCFNSFNELIIFNSIFLEAE